MRALVVCVLAIRLHGAAWLRQNFLHLYLPGEWLLIGECHCTCPPCQ